MKETAHVLSASRRTDIPAFYLDWFMDHIDKEQFPVTNPYTRQTRWITVHPDRFHTLVFWSKDFGPFLRSKAGETLIKKGFNLFFNFTVNSESPVLEPAVPALPRRLEQIRQLTDRFDPRAVVWRFDPICFYKTAPQRGTEDNFSDFSTIADVAGSRSIKKCVTSFFDTYAKINRRLTFLNRRDDAKTVFIQPDMSKKVTIIKKMEQRLAANNMRLSLCCEKEIFSRLGPDSGVSQNACIDGNYLKSIYNGNPVTQRDYGQRSKMGCQCTRSVDIGSYDRHPCHHNCLFCYANPEIDKSVKADKNQCR